MKFILLLGLGIFAFAETSVLEPVVVKAYDLKTCVSCHGVKYDKKALGKSKIVKDMSIDDIEDSLIGYKNGTYGGLMKGMMVSHVSKYSEDELREIAVQIKKDLKE